MRYVIGICLILLGCSVQSARLDSLQQAYGQATSDSAKFNLLTAMISGYLNTDASIAEGYAQDQFHFASNDRQKAIALLHLGLAHDYQYQFDTAIVYYHQATALFGKIKDSVMLTKALLNLGIVNYYKGDQDSAIFYYIQALEMAEKIGNEETASSALSNLGAIHKDLGDYDIALRYNQKSLALDVKRKDTNGIAISYNNMAMAYRGMEQYDKAFEYYRKCLNIRERLNDAAGLASVLTNIGQLHFTLKEFDKALKYNLRSLQYEEETNHKLGILESYVNVGDCYFELGEIDKAIEYLSMALKGTKEVVSPEVTLEALDGLSMAYAASGDFEKAYTYKSRYATFQDSLFEASHLQEVREVEAKYQTESMERENKLLKQQNTINELEIEQKELLERNLFVGLILLVVILFLVFYAYRSNISSSKKLAHRNHRIELMNNELKSKNKSITDSIIYAKRIQEAILPQDKLVKRYIENSFILYKPKDIVSGDFYWMQVLMDQVLFAAVDCTGHGVPGAFMSIVGNNGLNKAVKEKHNTHPAQILDILNEHVISSVQFKGGGVQDGMDIALCNLNIKKMRLQYAGANNPLYLIRNGEFIIINADKQAIGDVRRPFTNHDIALQKNDVFYIFTDGYADQFGGGHNKKFNRRRFREALLEIHTLSMEYQKEKLERILEEWQGNEEQLDDICIIGIKI